jgi:putative drug exporter of the RND superfamily
MTGTHSVQLDPVARHGRFTHALRISCLPILIG